MIHLTPQQLSAYLDGALTESSTELVRRHLSRCADCTQRFARMEAQEELLASLLTHEPGDEFFRSFLASFATEDSVGEAVAPSPKGKERRASKPTRAERRARNPERGTEAKPEPTPARAVAPEPAAKPEPMPKRAPDPMPERAPVVKAARAPEPRAVSPVLYGRREEDRTPAHARGRHSTAGWFAIAALVVIVAAVAVVATRERGAAPVTATTTRSSAETDAPPAPNTAPPAPAAPSPEELLEASAQSRRSAEAEPSAPSTTPAADVIPAPIAAPTTSAPEPARPPTRAAAKVNEPSPPASRTEERLVDRAPRNVVPVRTIVTETYVDSSGSDRIPEVGAARPSAPSETARSAAAAAAAARREFERARSTSLAAASTKSVEAFESAAAAWERALPLLGGLPEDQSLARRELAQARYQAWSVAPTPARRDAAVAAARGYLLYAPPGPDRDQAWTWLGRLKR